MNVPLKTLSSVSSDRRFFNHIFDSAL